MTRRSVFRAADAVSRRTVLATATTVCVGAVAGCLDDAEGDAESESGDGDHDRDHDHEEAAGDDVSDASYALASEMIDAIDDELSVTEWDISGTFVPRYDDSQGVAADASILGDAYADIVDQGFDHRAMPTALDDEGNLDFMVFLETEWARAYLDGEWSEEAYYAAIVDSEH